MKPLFPTRRLPERPDLEQLKRQAKELLAAYRARDEVAIAEVKRFYRAADPATFALHDAQLVLARNYGYGSWPKLKAYVDGVTATRLMEYSGGYAGTTDGFQINFRVPVGVPSGIATLQLSAAWVSGAAVKIPIQ